jgi:hypothetical protein
VTVESPSERMDSPPAEPPERDEHWRAVRAWLSAALLLVGTAEFVYSLALPAVGKTHGKMGTIHVDGWAAAMHYGPTAATNWFLATAFVVWHFAFWFRARWAWWGGVAFGVAAGTFHALIGAWPGFEGIFTLHDGYYVWAAASAAVMLAFLVLPKPRRAKGERLAPEEIVRGRLSLAWTFGVGGTLLLLGAHLLLPTSLGCEWRDGPPQRGDQFGWYTTGPMRSQMEPQTRKQLRRGPDGTFVEVEQRMVELRGPIVAQQMHTTSTALHETALLALPLLFVVAATTRRRAWRWGGLAFAAAVAAVTPFFDVPWPTSGFEPHPLAVLWWGTPGVFVAGVAVLPGGPRAWAGAGACDPGRCPGLRS